MSVKRIDVFQTECTLRLLAAGAKAPIILCCVCGTTEVVPCYKALKTVCCLLPAAYARCIPHNTQSMAQMPANGMRMPPTP